MKGIIFKYDANPSRWSDLRDGADNGCGLEDPDFSTNGFPVWAICGPYARKGVKPGDTLFFVPKMKGLREAGLGDRGYFCTGILCVAEIVGDEQTLQRDNRFSEAYKRKYTSSLKDHLRGDKERTKGIRPYGIVVGDPGSSRWLGREGYSKAHAFREVGLTHEDLSARRVSYLGPEQAARLYELLLGS